MKCTVLTLLFLVTLSQASIPIKYVQDDSRWDQETLGTSSNLMTTIDGSAVCSIAMALANLDIEVSGEVANPYSVNQYLKGVSWNGATATLTNTYYEGLGIQLEPVIPYAAETAVEYYESAETALSKGKPVMILRPSGHTVYVVGVVDGNFYVYDPSSTDDDDAILAPAETTSLSIFKQISYSSTPIECNDECITNPCGCSQFQCSASSFDCEIYNTTIPQACTSTSIDDFINFLKCTTGSCPCAFYQLDNSCGVSSTSTSILVAGKVPIAEFSSQLTSSADLGSVTLTEIQNLASESDPDDFYSAIRTQDLLLTTAEENAINSQFYDIVKDEIEETVTNFDTLVFPFRLGIFALYVENYDVKTSLIESDLWTAIEEGEWADVLRVARRGNTYNGFRLPTLFDRAIATGFECAAEEDTDPFGEMVFIFARGTSHDSNTLIEYETHMRNMVENLNIGSNTIQVGIVDAASEATNITETLSDDQNTLLTTFNTQYDNPVVDDDDDSAIAAALTAALSLFNNGSRAETRGDIAAQAPKTIILFTDGEYGGSDPSSTFTSAKNDGVNIIILTNSEDSTLLSILKLWASNEQAYSLPTLDVTDTLALAEDSMINFRYFLDLEDTPSINLFEGVATYIQFPVDNSGITVSIESTNSATHTYYISTDYRTPSSVLPDYEPETSGDTTTIQALPVFSTSSSSEEDDDEDSRRRVLVVSEGVNTLFIGIVPAEDDIITLTPQTGATEPTCPDNCLTCNQPGLICYTCASGYSLNIDTCEEDDSTEDDDNDQAEMYILNNDGGVLFLSHLKADYGDRTGLGIALGIVFGLLWIIIILVYAKKNEWTAEIEDPEKQKEAEKAKQQQNQNNQAATDNNQNQNDINNNNPAAAQQNPKQHAKYDEDRDPEEEKEGYYAPPQQNQGGLGVDDIRMGIKDDNSAPGYKKNLNIETDEQQRGGQGGGMPRDGNQENVSSPEKSEPGIPTPQQTKGKGTNQTIQSLEQGDGRSPSVGGQKMTPSNMNSTPKGNKLQLPPQNTTSQDDDIRDDDNEPYEEDKQVEEQEEEQEGDEQEQEVDEEQENQQGDAAAAQNQDPNRVDEEEGEDEDDFDYEYDKGGDKQVHV